MKHGSHDCPYLDPDNPKFVEDGDRYDKPVPQHRFTKAVRSVAVVVAANMLFAAGTPVSW
jgi:hypothetical protein